MSPPRLPAACPPACPPAHCADEQYACQRHFQPAHSGGDQQPATACVSSPSTAVARVCWARRRVPRLPQRLVFQVGLAHLAPCRALGSGAGQRGGLLGRRKDVVSCATRGWRPRPGLDPLGSPPLPPPPPPPACCGGGLYTMGVCGQRSVALTPQQGGAAPLNPLAAAVTHSTHFIRGLAPVVPLPPALPRTHDLGAVRDAGDTAREGRPASLRAYDGAEERAGGARGEQIAPSHAPSDAHCARGAPIGHAPMLP